MNQVSSNANDVSPDLAVHSLKDQHGLNKEHSLNKEHGLGSEQGRDIPATARNYFTSLNSRMDLEFELWCLESKSRLVAAEDSSCWDPSQFDWDSNTEDDAIIRLTPDTSLLWIRIDSYVAIQTFPPQAITPYLQIAQLFRQSQQQKATIESIDQQLREFSDQVDSLNQVNEEYLKQITADMEELTFLRQLCGFLELKGQKKDVHEELFQSIAHQVKSEWIGFIPVATNSQSILAHRKAICLRTAVNSTEGSPALDEITIEKLQTIVDRWKPQTQVLIENNLPDHELFEDSLQGIDSLLVCSVEKADQFFGWVIAVNRKQKLDNDFSFAPTSQKSEFGSVEAGLMSSAAATFATHFSNLDLLAANKELLTDVVRCLVTAIESKDSYTCGHSERVARYGQQIARRIGLDEKEIELIYLCGLLHDVGKIGIPDSILLKTEAPTKEEYDIIKKHPEDGWKILQSVKQLDAILDGVLFHHERVDGKGYPDGLANDEIPLHGKILAVADSFDAMTSDRPYRKGMPTNKAYKIIEEGADSQWDSEMVEAFLSITEEIESIKREYQRQPSPQRVHKTSQRCKE